MKVPLLYLRLLAVSVIVIGLAACGGSGVTNVSLGGTVTGLPDGTSLVLTSTTLATTTTSSASIKLTVSTNGAFTFPSRINVGAYYSITATPDSNTVACTVVGGAAYASSVDITTVTITCVPNNTLGGTVSGLTAGTSVVLANGSDTVTVAAPNPYTIAPVLFAFTNRVAQGFSYGVTVLTEPSGLTCNVANGVATMGTTDVTNVQVTCN